MSKPNGCPGLLLTWLFSRSQARGSTEVKIRGTAAMVKKRSNSREHTTNCGFRIRAHSSSRLDRVRPSASSAASAPTTAWTSAMAHPRIQHAVQDVDEQVDQDEGDERQRGQQHHDPTFLQFDGLEQELTESGQVEDAFGDDRATEHPGQVEADEGDHRQQRVRQDVSP